MIGGGLNGSRASFFAISATSSILKAASTLVRPKCMTQTSTKQLHKLFALIKGRFHFIVAKRIHAGRRCPPVASRQPIFGYAPRVNDTNNQDFVRVGSALRSDGSGAIRTITG